MKSLPGKSRIGIFNRSYYEDVLVVKVHPELLQNLPEGKEASHSGKIATKTLTHSNVIWNATAPRF